MNRYLKIILVGASGIIFLIIVGLFALWFLAPELELDLVSEDLPIPTSLHILRTRLQSSDKARIRSLKELKYVGRHANSLCSYQELVEISKIHPIKISYSSDNSGTLSSIKDETLGSALDYKGDIYSITYGKYGDCVSLPEGYIAATFPGDNLRVRGLYKKIQGGRLELVFLAKEFWPNDP